jgi:hypothetical protein
MRTGILLGRRKMLEFTNHHVSTRRASLINLIAIILIEGIYILFDFFI